MSTKYVGPVMLVWCLAVAGGCQSQTQRVGDSPHVVTKASEAQEAAMLGRIRSLQGEWVFAEGEEHAGQPASEFAVSSAGSAVREVMFKGTGHEMTNMYHMDGPDLAVTHYCAVGNQPRMRATAPSPDRIVFKPDGVSNLVSADKEYMANLTIVWNSDGTITQLWQSMKGGVPSEHASFRLRRKG